MLAAKNEKYVLADSLYGISLEIQPHPNAYFNRARVLSQLNNRAGYCENLAFSAGMGDKEAGTLFRKHCGTIDTFYLPPTKEKPDLYHFQVSYKSQYLKDTLLAHYKQNNSFYSFTWANEKKTFEKSNTNGSGNNSGAADSVGHNVNAEFMGGLPAMMQFIQENLQYPPYAREKHITGKVSLRFIINSLGYIEEVEILKGIKNCKECDDEAKRLVYSMPRWHPAKINGKPTITYFTLFLSFAIN